MSLDIMAVKPAGDKENSAFFNDYRLKIYERRKSSGLDDLLGPMRGIVVQVQAGDGLAYLCELTLMSPYRLDCVRLNDTHRIFFLRSSADYPRMIVLEPLDAGYTDDTTRFNMLYPRARPKANARYIGELFQTKDLAETQKVLESHEIRFHSAEEECNAFYANAHFRLTCLLYTSDAADEN